MKSIQHVLWRGALALSLMAVGIGTGVGMPPVEQVDAARECPLQLPTALVVQASAAADRPATVIVLRRRPVTPAG